MEKPASRPRTGKTLLVALVILALGALGVGGWWHADTRAQQRAAEKLEADSLDMETAPVLGEAVGKVLEGLCEGCGQRVVLLEMMDADDPDLYDVAELSRLETLNLSLCSVSDAGLSRIHGLKRLKHIDLAYNSDITAAGVAGLLAELDPVSLDLGGIDISPELATALSAEPALEQLVLSDGRQQDGELGWLARIGKLRSLSLRSSKGWDGEAAAALGGAAQLEQLDLTNTPVTDAIVPELAKLTKLKQLKAARTRLTEQGVAPLRARGVEVLLVQPRPKRGSSPQLQQMLEQLRQQQGPAPGRP